MKPRARLLERRGYCGDDYLVTDDLGSYVVRQGWFQAKGLGLVPDWRETIRIGDVLQHGNSMRIAREVLFKQDGILVSVTFTIRRCSWTHNCYTIMNRTDLASFGYRKTGARVTLGDAPLDDRIADNIRHRARDLDCCDVRGMA